MLFFDALRSTCGMVRGSFEVGLTLAFYFIYFLVLLAACCVAGAARSSSRAPRHAFLATDRDRQPDSRGAHAVATSCGNF